jgi:glycosyltransferase involved in cell wall biosynthesis
MKDDNFIKKISKMKLAFYYHVPLASKDGQLFAPSYFGVFLDSLASNVAALYLVFHEANDSQALECDYQLTNHNIRWVNLGLKTPAWHRDLFYQKVLKNKLDDIQHCDAFIVRSPSPLAPYFHQFISNNTTLFFMVVGDYLDGATHLKSSTFRDRIIYQYLKYNDRNFTKAIKKTNLLVNSIGLFEKYQKIAKSIHLIKTTTLSTADFYSREDTCQSNSIQLLYTGRIDVAKGLIELVEATHILIQEKYPVVLNIVGWEQDDVARPVENKMITLAKKLGIENQLIFHGRKKVGPELNKMYQQADLYVIPSYHEGFPRTIWEAMANSLPVIATKVGGIPTYLTHEKNAMLIEPKSVQEIVRGIKKMANDSVLRKKIIVEGFELVKSNTLEVQTKKMITIVSEVIPN